MPDSKSRSHHNSGFNSGLFLGLVLGGALGYFLSSKQGKKLLQGFKDITEEKLEELQDSEAVQAKIKKAQTAVEEAKKALSQKSTQNTSSSPKKQKTRFFKKGGSSLG